MKNDNGYDYDIDDHDNNEVICYREYIEMKMREDGVGDDLLSVTYKA